MPPPFRKITLSQFETLLRDFPFTRKIDSVHMHHTWRPTRADFNGHETIIGMWRFHTGPQNRWRDIAQHLTVDPNGDLWLGRDWNLPPASASGNNGTEAAGPFMFEMIGDFDHGREPFDDPQKTAALQVAALVLDHFRLATGALRFHNQMSSKSCPGSSISYPETLRQVDLLRRRTLGDHQEGVFAAGGGLSEEAAPEEILFGEEEGGETGEPAEGSDGTIFGEEGEPEPQDDGTEDLVLFGEDSTAPIAEPGAPAAAGDGAESEVADLIASLMLDPVTDTGPESPWAEPVEREGPTAPEHGGAARFATGQEGLFGPGITTDMKEVLRSHAINLTRGRLSPGGILSTTEADVERIFDEELEREVAGRDAQNPLKIVIWAHGGLVNEQNGLEGAYRRILWWKANNVFPLEFIWETGLLEALARVIRIRVTGREEAIQEGILDPVVEFSDRRIEGLARRLGGVAVWGDMKESARIAAEEADGGSRFVARKLAAFCARHPDTVELHAVGHSAGAIFHSHFLNAARQAGVPPFANLFLMAPAVRIDTFLQFVPPLLQAGFIRRVPLFTMNELRELDDNCITVYRKSLLYLIHFALERDRETPILGLEITLRGNQGLKNLFGLGGAAGSSSGEVIWSKSPANAGPRHRSHSRSHGGFDNDPATMNSLLRRVLDQDDVPVPFEKAGDLFPETAVPPGATPGDGGIAGTDFVLGEESLARATPRTSVEDERFGVPFDVLDAFERAAEAMPEDTFSAAAGFEARGFGTESVAAPASIEIAFGPNARQDAVTVFSRQVLTDILRRAGISRVVITSTSRDASEQARVMFQNLERFGVDHQKRLYGPAGDQVIEVYHRAKAQGLDAGAIRARMTQEILSIGPTRVSRHAADPRVLNVFDISPASVANRAAFEREVRNEPRVTKFLIPPQDPGYHLEIPQT